jgi:hypothetical protein
VKFCVLITDECTSASFVACLHDKCAT